ncbi:AraC family transcriptional regulator [Comamonas sp. GB3 AK4-5]|uniref:AraC family transcriptional regulator n=1 Tax=Comamonas sp. GB3 AK4-5 TaxID=3231487 RepID=UPI00351E822B
MLGNSSEVRCEAKNNALPADNANDLLSQILVGLRLDGVEYNRCELRGPWAVAHPAQSWARFHFVGSGSCWLRTAGSDWLQLRQGDAVLLPRGSLHILASAPEVPAVDIDSLARTTITDNIHLVGPCGAVRGRHLHHAGHGHDHAAASAAAGLAPTVVFSGALRFNLDPLHPLLAMMPEVMQASDLAARDPAVPALLDAMEREVAFDRIGACGILARLADVLAATVIRGWLESRSSDNCAGSGWITAVRCPKIGKVIAAIHAEPERSWTVPMLAELINVSRSSFAESFTRTMGESPAKYVAKVRMFEARRWIAQDQLRIATVADRLGYDSEASFSRAFKRIIGHPPSAARGSAAMASA